MGTERSSPARAARTRLASRYREESAGRSHMADLAHQSGFSNVEENLRNLASRSAHYADTAERMNAERPVHDDIIDFNRPSAATAGLKRMPSFGRPRRRTGGS